MKNYNLVYNYGFLADWFKANKQIRRNDFLTAMGMSDYNTLRNWYEGETQMPLTQMMKFCNRFNVPITAFFYDACADENSFITPLHANAMIEPAGGWPDANRKIGIKVCDPRTDKHQDTKLPEYCKHPTLPSTDEEEHEQADNSTSDLTTSERMRFLDIIEQMQKDIMELTKKTIQQAEAIAERDARINAMAQDRPYTVVKQYEPMSEQQYNVAEE